MVTNLTLEGEDDAAELDVREAEVRLLCEAVAPERLFVSTGDSRLARTQADLGCGGLDLARFTATPGGFSLPGRTGRYWLGADQVGESALLHLAGSNAQQSDIRAVINRDNSIYDEEGGNFVDSLIFWRDPQVAGTIVDPAKEDQRLQEAEATGAAANAGETAVIERREQGILEGLF